jgi:hypothetical protein
MEIYFFLYDAVLDCEYMSDQMLYVGISAWITGMSLRREFAFASVRHPAAPR